MDATNGEVALGNQIDKEALLERVLRPLSSSPRPFLRWAGSKRLLLPSIVPTLPLTYNRYIEPFLGGAALFFALEPEEAILGDSCRDLIRTYQAVRDNSGAVARYLRPLRPNKERFYQVRSNMSRGRLKRAAQFIYLNKTCWNGLYRVNSSGQFNVPYGSPRSDNIFDQENLLSCSRALAKDGVEIVSQDFEETAKLARAGDLVYFDPPYVTGHNNNGFVDYNEVLFSWRDQVRLARRAEILRKSGVFVLVSNANHDAIKDLYPNFERVTVERRSNIASNSNSRGLVTESLFVGRLLDEGIE